MDNLLVTTDTLVLCHLHLHQEVMGEQEHHSALVVHHLEVQAEHYYQTHHHQMQRALLRLLQRQEVPSLR